MFKLASGYKERGMAAYSELQQEEFASEAQGYTATRHQREVGTGWFDAVAVAASGGRSSTTAMAGSTETEQFHGEGHVAPMVPQMAQQQASRMVPVAQEQEHDHDDGLVHGHGWAATVQQVTEAAHAHQGYDEGLVHGHNWAWSD